MDFFCEFLRRLLKSEILEQAEAGREPLLAEVILLQLQYKLRTRDDVASFQKVLINLKKSQAPKAKEEEEERPGQMKRSKEQEKAKTFSLLAPNFQKFHISTSFCSRGAILNEDIGSCSQWRKKSRGKI